MLVTALKSNEFDGERNAEEKLENLDLNSLINHMVQSDLNDQIYQIRQIGQID